MPHAWLSPPARRYAARVRRGSASAAWMAGEGPGFLFSEGRSSARSQRRSRSCDREYRQKLAAPQHMMPPF